MKVEGDKEFKRACRKVIDNYPEFGVGFVRDRVTDLHKRTRSKTKKGKTKNLYKGWKKKNPRKAKIARGEIEGEVLSTAPHAHLYEYGHRQTKEKGGPEIGPPVPGRFPLTTSLEEVNRTFEEKLSVKLHEFTKEIKLP